MSVNRPTQVCWGSESYYALLRAGWTEMNPFPSDAESSLRIMTAPGYREPKPALRWCFREMARSERGVK